MLRFFTVKRLHSKALGRQRRGVAAASGAPWVAMDTKTLTLKALHKGATSSVLSNAFGVTFPCCFRPQGGVTPLHGFADPGFWNVTPSV